MDLFRIIMVSFVFVILGLTAIYIITVISKKNGKDLIPNALMTQLKILLCAVIVVAILAVATIIGVYS